MPGASTWFLSHSSSTFLPVLYLNLIFFIFFLSNHGASGKPTNRTIDDTFGDSSDPSIKPLFLPLTNGVWEDASCTGCAIQPEKSKAFRGTWTAATYNKGLGNVSVTLPFTGTAIHVFFILANDQGPGITTTTECNFTLDGQLAGNFVHKPTTSKALMYNESALVHSSRGLKNTNHELLISTSGVDHDVFVNFDYAIYTFDDSNSTSSSSPSSSSSSNSNSPTSNSGNGGSTSQSNLTAVVIGTILGGVAALAAAGLIIYFYCRRRKLERHFEGVGVGGVESTTTSNHHPPYPPTPGPIPIPPQTPPWNTTNQNPSRVSHAISDDMVSYIGQDNYTTLPTGEVVLSAATRPSQRYTVARAPSLIYTGRPRTLVLHNRDSVSSTYPMPMSPATVSIQRTRELETQMQGIKREMRYLEVQAAEEGREERGYDAGIGENKSLGEQLQEMREQVRLLQAQIQPPPGYTPT